MHTTAGIASAWSTRQEAIRQAADCYRKVIALIRAHPDDYDPGFEDIFHNLVAKLDPPAAS